MRLDEEVAERLLQRSGRVPESDAAVESHPARSARMARVIQASLRHETRIRRFRRRALLAASGVAVAALLVLVVNFGLASRGGGQPPGPSLVATKGDVKLLSKVTGGAELGRGGMQLSDDVELLTGDRASAELELASGARVSVGETTALQLPSNERAPLSERVALRSGRVELRVPKLAPGHVLSVVTPNATVTVRGTRFSVNVDTSGSTPLTHVEVVNGRVEVTGEGQHLFLARGQQWSSRAEEHVPAAATMQDAPVAEPAPLEAKTASDSANATKTELEREAQSSLALQNRLLEQALSKARSGRFADALAALERLLRDHPRSPLIQSVRVEHFRVLRQAGRTEEAAREARRYLSAYPNGFARDDARRTVLFSVQGAP